MAGAAIVYGLFHCLFGVRFCVWPLQPTGINLKGWVCGVLADAWTVVDSRPCRGCYGSPVRR
jgi:hypothetical protein